MARDFRVERPADAEAFLELAGAYLESHEAEDCLMLGIAGNLRRGTLVLDEPPLLAVVVDGEAGNGAVAAALRTPPYDLVVSMAEDLEAIDALASALNGEALPGVSGPRDSAARFAQRWTADAGRHWTRSMAERVFRLTAVHPPRAANGRMRLADRDDRNLLIAWIDAFELEALGKAEDTEASVDRWIARVGRSFWLWEDADVRVSLCGAGGETEHGIRIGPVYTPPEHRGHGYASNLVAGVSQLQLDAGRRFVTLFTDLANPTSNHIYQEIGYEPVIDFDKLEFVD
jgi:predicted GNAT family acetyltransferase